MEYAYYVSSLVCYQIISKSVSPQFHNLLFFFASEFLTDLTPSLKNINESLSVFHPASTGLIHNEILAPDLVIHRLLSLFCCFV